MEVTVGEQQEQQEQRDQPKQQEQPKTGWLARWRERRRSNSARAADISRRVWEADRRNMDNLDKYRR
jgi:hypothetical protein